MPKEGEIYVCSHCGSELQVIKASPDPKCPSLECCNDKMKLKG